MGEQQIANLEGVELRSFIERLLDDVRALEKMIAAGSFEQEIRRIGAEQEMFLVDDGWRPACKALEVLEEIDDPHFTTELGLFNLEANLDPVVFGGSALRQMETQLIGIIDQARAAAAARGAHVVMVGILPTIRKSDLTLDAMTPFPRYRALNDTLGRLRGGAYDFQIKGLDELAVKHDNVMVEACNTSFQVHFQVSPDEFARLYNIAQLITAPVLAASTNSPLMLGRRLWRETRIALFQQSIDTRGSSHHLRERAPRVGFGSRWVRESVVEIFKEDILRFRALVGAEPDEHPFDVLNRGEIPQLKALRIHNGTVYRWNRACYGLTDGKPHLRVENRALPSGPTPRDEMASAALWFGLLSAFSHEPGDVAEQMEFARAKANFNRAARYGLDTVFDWLGRTVPARKLLLDELLPMAAEGLRERSIDEDDIEEYLGVVERRVREGRTGADWMLESLETMDPRTSLSERIGALTAAMVARQAEGGVVADWELATVDEAGGWKHNYLRVEQYMTTDLFTVHEDEPIELVARLMDWEKIRHVPVEDTAQRLVGLVSYRTLMRVMNADDYDGKAAVGDVMKRGLTTINPETKTLEAIRLMKSKGVGCLPVVKNDRLVGIVTERDFMELARNLMEQALEEVENE